METGDQFNAFKGKLYYFYDLAGNDLTKNEDKGGSLFIKKTENNIILTTVINL